MFDLIIIGAGPAGMSAAVYASKANLNTLLIESDTPGGLLNKINKIDNYLGFKNRYDIDKCNIDNMHPYICAKVLLDKKEIGIIGKIHPEISRDDIYVLELSMNALMIKSKPLKYKEANKYPGIEKDLAFVVPKKLEVKELIKAIKKSGGRLLKDIKVFDVYDLDNSDKCSIAFKLLFEDESRTLTDEEVMTNFNNIIHYVESNCNATLRDK